MLSFVRKLLVRNSGELILFSHCAISTQFRCPSNRLKQNSVNIILNTEDKYDYFE